MSVPISKVKKIEIIVLYKQNRSIRDVSRITGISYTSVQRVIKKSLSNVGIEKKIDSGRPYSLTISLRNILMRSLEASPEKTANDHLKVIKNKVGLILKKRTMNKYFHSLGFESCNPVKKPLLREVHIRSRLEACNEWLYWTDDKWKSVIFSD